MIEKPIGRDAEQRRLRAFLSGDPAPALLLAGDAGIGKTALWEWAVAEAARDRAVLTCRAGAAEARLPWVVLTDLLSSAGDAVVDALPAPQSRALRIITLRETADGEEMDERLVGTALTGALDVLAGARTALIAIDDLTYVDAASAAALRFALRRLPDRIRLLATARDPAGTPQVGTDPDVVTIGPLTVGALFELLDSRLGVRLPRPVLLRVHETSGGNPLYAMELARALHRLEITPAPGEPLPVPAGLTALVADRVRRLPPDLAEITAGTAAAWRLTETGLDPARVDAAVEAGVVTVAEPPVSGPRIVRAVHPLVGAAAYAALAPDRRRALHERLATIVDDPVERARHAALAGTGPDPEVAAAVDAGVRAALAAGTPAIAADLARLALARTGSDADRPDRLDRLADALFRTGDTAGAAEAQRRSVTLSATVADRVRRRTRLAEIVVEIDGWDAGEAEMVIAVAEAEADPGALPEALLTLAAVTDDVPRAMAAAVRAVDLLEAPEHPDPATLGPALAQVAGIRFRAGLGLDHEMFARAIALEAEHPNRRLSDRADASYAALLKYADDLDGAERRLTDLLAEARESGDLSSIAYAVAHLPQIALWRGDFARAHAYVDEHLAVAEQGGLGSQVTQARYSLASVLAHEGALDEAEAILAAVRDASDASRWERIRAYGFLGFVALSRGDALAAAGHLDEWDALLREIGFTEPGYTRSHLDYVSALVGCGRLDDARSFLDRLEAQVASSGRQSAGAVARTGRALVASAEGRPEEAVPAIDAVLDWYDHAPLRVDRARTLLLAGQIRRRAKAKTAARAALDEARSEFLAMGAVAWADRATAEIARVNLRPNAPTDLTETERRVAELAATGLTNREVGERLFLAVKTVEANLARVYRKLGIRTRAELGARFGGGAPRPAHPGGDADRLSPPR